MAPNFLDEAAALLTALTGGRPVREHYAGNISLQHERTGSANHKMLCNPTEALDALNRGDRSRVDAVLDWCEDYYLGTALHENEALSPNGAYRPAIEEGTWLLAGCAHEAGRIPLRDKLLARSRGGIAWILLGVGPTQARTIRNHHLDKVGRAVLFVGDGQPSGVAGLPYFAQAGKRGHVREGGSGNHVGPLSDPQHTGIGALVAMAVGKVGDVPKPWSAVYRAAVKRWPGLPPFGFSAKDREVAKAFIKNPLEQILAREVLSWAAPHRPDLPFVILRFESGAVAFLCLRSSGSSTGCTQGDVELVDGTHYLASADTASRGGTATQSQNIQPQICVETPDGFACSWVSGQGLTITAPRPPGAVAYRIETTAAAARFVSGGSEPVQPAPPSGPSVPTPTAPPVKKKKRRPWWKRLLGID